MRSELFVFLLEPQSEIMDLVLNIVDTIQQGRDDRVIKFTGRDPLGLWT